MQSQSNSEIFVLNYGVTIFSCFSFGYEKYPAWKFKDCVLTKVNVNQIMSQKLGYSKMNN